VGQGHVIRTLRNALISGRIHHAYLFAGPRGTGKTTTARLLAKAVNCLAPEEERPCNECTICQAINEGRLLDLIEIDAASNTGVDDVRELRERVSFQPNEARYKVYVIDEVHMLSNAAFNALLKTLEEPPAHAIFVLATTEPHKILPTVLSRCQRFDFHRISIGEIVDRLALLAEKEGIQAEREALSLIARQATGSMRDAESLLDQLASYNDGGITVEEIHAALGIGADETVMQLTEALSSGDVAQGLGAINSAIDEGADPRHFARQMVEHLRALLLLRLKSGVILPHVTDDMRPHLEEQAAGLPRRYLAQTLQLFNEAAYEARGGWQPQLPLEMAFIEAVLAAEPEPSPPSGGASPRPKPHSAPRPTPTAGTAKRKAQERSPKPQAPDSQSSPSPQPSPEKEVREPSNAYEEATDQVELSLDALQSHWADFLYDLRLRNISLEAQVKSCELAAVEDDVVVLQFNRTFNRDTVAKDEKRHIVEDTLSDLFGQQVQVRCVVAKQKQNANSDQRPDTSNTGGNSRKTESSNPLVDFAVQELGARVLTS
jgi:DNA polymerase-3 subunit gamma/tau